jgi:hypothetical protein
LTTVAEILDAVYGRHSRGKAGEIVSAPGDRL